MELMLLLIVILAGLVWLWLNLLASIAVRNDSTLEPFQRQAQTVFVWLVPFIGAATVLNLVWQQYPESIPKSWIPWPFKRLIIGKPSVPNRDRNDDESAAINGTLSRDHGIKSSIGNDGGGGD